MKLKDFIIKFDGINLKYDVKIDKKEKKRIHNLLKVCFVMGGKNKALKFLDEYEKALINKIKEEC